MEFVNPSHPHSLVASEGMMEAAAKTLNANNSASRYGMKWKSALWIIITLMLLRNDRTCLGGGVLL